MNEKGTYTKLQRLLARIALAGIALLLLLIFWLMATGASPASLLGALFCLIVLPCLIYALNLYIRHTTGKRKKETDQPSA